MSARNSIKEAEMRRLVGLIDNHCSAALLFNVPLSIKKNGIDSEARRVNSLAPLIV